MAKISGIGARGRAELGAVLRSGRRFVRPADLVTELGVDSQAATKKLSRWADEGWLRRARRGLYIPVPLDVRNPQTWAEDPLLIAEAVWSPCYFTGWTAANHWRSQSKPFEPPYSRHQDVSAGRASSSWITNIWSHTSSRRR